MTAAMLVVDGVRVRRGSLPVLRQVSFRAGAGELVGVVGPNGAGKSTLLAALAGLIRAQGGRAVLQGRDVLGLSPQRLLKAGLALVPQGRRVFPNLSVRRNLELGATVVRDRAVVARRLDRFLERYPTLARRTHDDAVTLSGGEQSLLVLGRGLMSEPTVLLVDEPLMGLAAPLAAQVLDHLSRYAHDGRTVVLVDHQRAAVESVATSVLRIEDGVARALS
jgi:branched-chain amino acid transport system ATP-binding protein